MRTLRLAAAAAALAVGLAATTSLAKDDKAQQWADGIPYTTDYEAAIKEARETGRMLLVYNGWEREKI